MGWDFDFLKRIQRHIFIQGIFIEQLLCSNVPDAMDIVITKECDP